MSQHSLDELWRTHNRVHSLIIQLRNAKIEEISSITIELNKAAWKHGAAMASYSALVKENP